MSDIAADATAYANRHQSQLVRHRVPTRRQKHLDLAWNRVKPAFTGAYMNFESRPTLATNRLAFRPRPGVDCKH